MYCENCGNLCPEGTSFCAKCGAPLLATPVPPATTPPVQDDGLGAQIGHFACPRVKRKKSTAMIVWGAVLTALALLLIVASIVFWVSVMVKIADAGVHDDAVIEQFEQFGEMEDYDDFQEFEKDFSFNTFDDSYTRAAVAAFILYMCGMTLGVLMGIGGDLLLVFGILFAVRSKRLYVNLYERGMDGLTALSKFRSMRFAVRYGDITRVEDTAFGVRIYSSGITIALYMDADLPAFKAALAPYCPTTL